MSSEGKIGKKFRQVQNRERTHDHTNVATLGDVRDLLPPLSPAQHSCWREELHKAAKMCHTRGRQLKKVLLLKTFFNRFWPKSN